MLLFNFFFFLHKNCAKSCFSSSIWTGMWRYWKQSTVSLISPDLICSSFDSCGDNGQSLMNFFLSHWDRKSIQFSISQLCVITISANVLSTVCSCRPFIWQSVYIEWKLYNRKVDKNGVNILGSSTSGFSVKQSSKVNIKFFSLRILKCSIWMLYEGHADLATF